ncbi:hypothetical protein PilKf_02067 [Pillotina sp. SPG140]|jgi:hypothetical protein
MALSPYDFAVLPSEYQRYASDLLDSTVQTIENFADILGIGKDYRKFLSDHNLDQLLKQFQNNIDILIEKTWVLSTDKHYKDLLRDRIPGFVDTIKQSQYQEAIEHFTIILAELAYLFFGEQSTAHDFIEWVFRIDDRIGLFWWYSKQLAIYRDKKLDDAVLKAMLFIGLCYLADF